MVLGELTAMQNLGGFFGRLNERSLEITDCRFAGSLHHKVGGEESNRELPAAGGLAGICAYTTLTAEGCAVDMTWSTDCADRTAPTFMGSVGGLAGYGSAGLDLAITGCSVRLTAADQAVDNMDIGGLCGRHYGSGGAASVRDTVVVCQVDLLHKNGSVAAGMIPKIGSAAFVNCGANVDIRMEALESARISVSGMCWDVDSSATYAKCYTYGDIRAAAGDNDVYAAGLSNIGQASQCYSGVDITVDSAYADVAGLIVSADGKPIISSWSDASLRVKTTGTSRVGGLAQFASGNITDSCFTGSITTNNASWLGGICAVSAYSTPSYTMIRDCTSKGVTCYMEGSGNVGGIAGGAGGGEDSFAIANCRVDGDVRMVVDGASGNVGGIAGGTGAWIHNCVMKGDVSIFVDIPAGTPANDKGTVSAGGIAGWMHDSNDCTLSRSYHMGGVSATHSGDPAPNFYLKHPLVGYGGRVTDSDFSFAGARDEETYIIRTWWHEETDTIMQPLGDVAVFVAGEPVGTTNESGELVLESAELADNARLMVSAEKDGYRGSEKEAWFADDGVLNLYLMKKTPGKIYLKAARIYDREGNSTELLYTNSTVNISQEEQQGRKMYFEVDWNDLEEEGRTLQLVNEDESRCMTVSDGVATYVNVNECFQQGDKFRLKATACDALGERKTAEAKLGLSIYAIICPDLYLESNMTPLGDNGSIRGIDFLSGLDIGVKGSLGPVILDTSYVNNVFKVKFGGNAIKTPKLTLMNTQARVTVFGEIQAAAEAMSDSLEDAEWSGSFGAEVALDPALDYGMTVPPLAFNTEIKGSLGGTLNIYGPFKDPDIGGTFNGGAEFGIVAGLGAAASDMCVIAGPEIGAKGDFAVGLKSTGTSAEDIDDLTIEGDVSVAVVVKGGEFFEFHPSYQLGRFKWTNKDGMEVYGLGIELTSAREAARLRWMPSGRDYLEEGGGFCGDMLGLLAWNGEETVLPIYENIMLDSESVLTLEGQQPVLYFTADDGETSLSGTVAQHTVLWRAEKGADGWNTPRQISQSGAFVDNLDADGPFAIWVDADQTQRLSDLLTSADVMVYANREITRLTQEEGYVYGAKISASANGEEALAIWFSDPDVERAEDLFDQTGRTLWYAHYDGSTWSKPKKVDVGDKTIVSAAPSCSQDDIYWTDETGTMYAYYYSYTPYGGKILSGIGMSAHADQYTAAMTADGLSVWDDKTLKATIPVQAIEVDMIRSGDHYCVVWSESDGIYYADNLDNWVRKPVVQTGQQPQGLSAVMLDGKPQVSYSLSAYHSDETMLLKHLYLAKPADLSGVDLAVSHLDLNTDDVEHAGAARLTAVVTNLREDVVSAYTYTLLEDEKQVASGEVSGLQLNYGGSHSSLVVFAPDTSAAHTYTLIVEAAGDCDKSNDSLQVQTTAQPYVAETGFPVMPSGETGLEAIVGNAGAAPAEQMTVEIYRCAADGTVTGAALVSETFASVAGGSYRQVVLDKADSHQFYKVVVLSDGKEVDSDMLMWKDTEAQLLQVSDVSVTRRGAATVELFAQNDARDVRVILALYQAGQMKAVDLVDTAAWNGSKTVELALGRQEAGEYTCVVYLVHPQSLQPFASPYEIPLTF